MALAAAPKKGLQVIGAGYGRTGTLSLSAALELLYGGAHCYHMKSILFPSKWDQLGDLYAWSDAAAAGVSPDWGALLDARGCAAAVDFPICLYYAELAERYPDAKVILTVRSSSSWLASFSKLTRTVGKATLMTRLMPRMRVFRAWLRALIFAPVLGSPDALETGELNDAAAVAAYEAHNAAVIRTIPPERLLVLELGAGWEPLCEFLGLPVPDVPYPRMNQGKDMNSNMFNRRMLSVATMSVVSSPVV